jgi:hypothetical protein
MGAIVSSLIIGQDNPVNYHLACKALVDAVDSSGVPKWGDDKQLQAFYHILICQPHCKASPPVLHSKIAALLALGSITTVSRIASELTPTMKAIQRSGEITKNYVVLLLLLREFLPWMSARQISKIHLTWLNKFEFNDLSLPYRSIFGSTHLERNFYDVDAHLSDVSTRAERVEHFRLSQLVFFEWLTGLNLLGDRSIGYIIDRLRDMAANGYSCPIEVAAAKSLIVRHATESDIPDVGALASLSGCAELVDVTQKTVTRRQSLYYNLKSKRPFFRERLFHSRIFQAAQAAKSLAAIKCNFAHHRRRRLKVAVCVSGQLRGYKRAFASWNRTILAFVDSRIFVHSWTRIGRSGAEYFRHSMPFEGLQFIEQYRKIGELLGQDELQRRYPALFERLANTGTTTTDEVASHYGSDHIVLDDETASPFAGWSNSQKMHYKIEACHALATRSGEEFDLVIRIRPDKAIQIHGFDWRDVNEICHSRPVIFADHGAGVQFGLPCIGDQIAVGTPEAMSIYSSAWTDYPRFAQCGLLNCPQAFGGHGSLGHICWLNGIAVEPLPWRGGRLEDPEALSSADVVSCLRTSLHGRSDSIDNMLLEAAMADLAVE